jgi:non-specific serine/threonine protein kinase
MDLVGGEPLAARQKIERSLAMYRALGDGTGVAKTGEGLVAVLTKLEDYATALPLQEEVIGRYRALGNLYHVGEGLSLQARIAIGLGDRVKARASLDEAIEILTTLDSRGGPMVGVLIGAALLAAENGDGRRAARLYAAAMTMRADEAVGVSPTEILGLPNPVDRAKALLGEEAYAAAYREGTALPFDAVIAEALA